jgi:hypothetical protein
MLAKVGKVFVGGDARLKRELRAVSGGDEAKRDLEGGGGQATRASLMMGALEPDAAAAIGAEACAGGMCVEVEGGIRWKDCCG